MTPAFVPRKLSDTDPVFREMLAASGLVKGKKVVIDIEIKDRHAVITFKTGRKQTRAFVRRLLKEDDEGKKAMERLAMMKMVMDSMYRLGFDVMTTNHILNQTRTTVRVDNQEGMS